MKTRLINSPARQTERLFNCMPKDLRESTGVTVDTFKKHLDKWLMEKVPDQPRCEGYTVAAASNSIVDQYSHYKRVRGQ